MRPSSLVIALAPLLAACAGSGTTASTTPGPTSAAAGAGRAAAADSTRLSAAEIAAADLPTAFDLVERLRRPWLRRSGPMGGEVMIYMDQRAVGGSDELRQIPAATVTELQYVAHDEAVRRWGSQITGAVIVVVRRR